MQFRWLTILWLGLMLFLVACSDEVNPPLDGAGDETASVMATPDSFGLLDNSPQSVNTEGIPVGGATVTIEGATTTAFTAMPTATDLGAAGWQINLLDSNGGGGGTIQLSLPKGIGTGVYEVVRSADAMGTEGFTKVAVEMVIGVGAEIQMMEIEGGQLRLQGNAPLTAELTFVVPTAEGAISNVTVIFNQVPLEPP